MKSVKSLVAGIMILSFSMSAFAQEEEGEHRGPRGHRPKLTDVQRSCLEGILGAPGEGERPTREQMEAAFTSCEIPKPPKRPASE